MRHAALVILAAFVFLVKRKIIPPAFFTGSTLVNQGGEADIYSDCRGASMKNLFLDSFSTPGGNAVFVN